MFMLGIACWYARYSDLRRRRHLGRLQLSARAGLIPRVPSLPPHFAEIQPCEGVHDLLKEVKKRGFTLVLASSGTAEVVETFIDLIDARSLAGKLDIPTIAVQTGGYSVEELRHVGAVTAYDFLVAMREHLDDTPLARPTS